LLVDTDDAEMQRVFELDLDGVGLLDLNGMREAQRQDQLVALLGGTVADALDLEVFLEAFGDTDDHVVDDGAGQAVEAAGLLLVIGAGNQNLIALDLDVHEGMVFGMQGTLGALHGDGVLGLVDLDFHPRGNDDGFSSNSRHCLLPLSYHTKARTSPPTCAARAALSVMTPFEVEMIAVPRPFMTLGISSQLV